MVQVVSPSSLGLEPAEHRTRRQGGGRLVACRHQPCLCDARALHEDSTFLQIAPLSVYQPMVKKNMMKIRSGRRCGKNRER